MNELALFAGAGGGILGGRLLGWRTVGAVEIEPYARRVLLARQRDGLLDRFPVWDDVTTFDGTPWRGYVDVISGGFPCQDISITGKGAGITGERSGLWAHMARIIREVRPRHVFVENSPALTSRGLGVVLGDLAASGYDARWCVLGAVHVGAPHRRLRIWIRAELADTNQNDGLQFIGGEPRSIRDQASKKHSAGGSGEDLQYPHSDSFRADKKRSRHDSQRADTVSAIIPNPNQGRLKDKRGSWWETEPAVGRVVDGLADRVDRLAAIGNGQVPSVAALAWRLLE